jgi:hypothetical protein
MPTPILIARIEEKLKSIPNPGKHWRLLFHVETHEDAKRILSSFLGPDGALPHEIAAGVAPLEAGGHVLYFGGLFSEAQLRDIGRQAKAVRARLESCVTSEEPARVAELLGLGQAGLIDKSKKPGFGFLKRITGALLNPKRKLADIAARPDIEALKRNERHQELIRALDHSDLEVRLQAARALGELAEQHTYNPITVGVGTANAWIEQVAARSAGRRPAKFPGDGEAFAKIRELLRQAIMKRPPDAGVKEILLEALHSIER